MNTPTTAPGAAATPSEADIDAVYRELKAGRGREGVDDDNVEALIRRAARDGDAQLEALLREWRSPCGDDPDAPRLEPSLPPPRGVGRGS